MHGGGETCMSPGLEVSATGRRETRLQVRVRGEACSRVGAGACPD